MEILVPSTAASPLYVPESAQVARTFLSELRSAHRDLLKQIQALEVLSQAPSADAATLATARWRLGQASLSRRLLAGRIGEYFKSRCPAEEAVALQSLSAADREMLRLSAVHLSKWTAETIARDWDGYCHDGRAIRRQTQVHIALEQHLLYPLLERSAKQG
jgi:hypothetical protein